MIHIRDGQVSSSLGQCTTSKKTAKTTNASHIMSQNHCSLGKHQKNFTHWSAHPLNRPWRGGNLSPGCSSRLHTSIENALHKESKYFSKPAKSGRSRSKLHLAGLCRKRQQPKPMDGINTSTKHKAKSKETSNTKNGTEVAYNKIPALGFGSKARETPNPTVLIRFQR